MDRDLIYRGLKVKIQWVGVQYTMDRVRYNTGRGFDIPWVGGQIYHG